MNWNCTQSLHGRHGEVNSTGHCVYCGVFLYKQPKPNLHDPNRRDERQDYYDYFWNPDGPEK